MTNLETLNNVAGSVYFSEQAVDPSRNIGFFAAPVDTGRAAQ